MEYSIAQKKAKAEYIKRRDSIMIRPDKETGAAIRAAAAAAGQSVQRYVLDAVQLRMEKEADNGIPD